MPNKVMKSLQISVKRDGTSTKGSILQGFSMGVKKNIISFINIHAKAVKR